MGNRRTLAPRGQTPLQRAWDRHDRLSVIGGVALAPQRERLTRHTSQVLINRCGQTTIEEFLRVLYNSQRHLSCESGSALFTAQLGIPSTLVFRPGQPEREKFAAFFRNVPALVVE